MVLIVGCLLALGGFYYWMNDEGKPLVGCEEKEISEVMVCSEGEESGCSYRFTDDSLDVRESGLKIGDKVKVCREPSE